MRDEDEYGPVAESTALDVVAAIAASFVKWTLGCALLAGCVWFWIWLGRAVASVFTG